MDTLGRKSRLDFSDDRVRAHVDAIKANPSTQFDPGRAICTAAVERGILEASCLSPA